MAEFFRLGMNVDGIQVVDRLLRGIPERAADLTPAWPAVVMVFRGIELRAFTTEGASTDLGAWPQLAIATQRQRQREGYGAAHPILQRSGRLMRAMTEGVGVYERMERTRLQIQLSEEEGVKYAVHQRGAPSRNIPRRAMVSFTADDRHALVRPIQNYLMGRDPNAPSRGPAR